MRCRDIEALCSSYVDGDLEERRASALRGHLRICADCRRRVEDEAAVCAAASDLGQLDPPANLWSNIEARLAEKEIADARRSRSWWWWQRLRPQALPIAVGAVAVVALVVWSQQRRAPQPAQSAPAVVAVAPSHAGADAVVEAGPSFEEQRLAEVVAADRLYHDTIAELNQIIAEERRGWTARQIAEFDAEVVAHQAATRRQRQALAVNQSQAPATRDALYTVYRAQIGFLQRAAVGELRR